MVIHHRGVSTENIHASNVIEMDQAVFMHLGICMCIYIYQQSVRKEAMNLKEQRGEGKREKGCNYIRVSKKMKEIIFKTQYIRG